MYEDFVKDFGGDDEEAAPKAFVRGGVIEPGKQPSSSLKPPPGAKRHYVPSFAPPGMAAAAAEQQIKAAAKQEVRCLPAAAPCAERRAWPYHRACLGRAPHD